MKVKEECAHCGKHAKVTTIVTVKDDDRDKFIQFCEVAQQAGHQGLIPPSKYTRHPLIVPSPGQNPCPHCKHGAETVGPSGCGRSQVCLVWKYYQVHNLTTTTGTDPLLAIKEFSCDVPNASWLSPTKKRPRAQSVAVTSPQSVKTSSAKAASSQKSEDPKSKWQKQLKTLSKTKSSPSRKRASARAKR